MIFNGFLLLTRLPFSFRLPRVHFPTYFRFFFSIAQFPVAGRKVLFNVRRVLKGKKDAERFSEFPRIHVADAKTHCQLFTLRIAAQSLFKQRDGLCVSPALLQQDAQSQIGPMVRIIPEGPAEEAFGGPVAFGP